MSTSERAANTGTIMKYQTGGVFDAVDELARAIKSLGEKHHLIIPGGAIGSSLPLLYAAGVSFVFVDPENETYSIVGGKGKLGLTKTALDRIARAAGVRWDPHFCGRTDDGASPYFVEYQAVGTVLQMDGTESLIQASKRIDLRGEKGKPDTWGTDTQEFVRQAEGKDRDPWNQVLQQRQHILSLAESKAKNRAIRSLGVRTAYTRPELEKGFAVVRLQFTGRSEDPETQHEIEMMIAQRALSSTAMMYGGEVHRGLPPASAAPIPQRIVPKVIVTTAAAEDDDSDNSGLEAPPPEKTSQRSTEQKRSPAKEVESEEEQASRMPIEPESDPLLICGDKDPATGKYPRKPCSAFDVKTLQAKIWSAEKNRPNWSERWAAKNEEELRAMKQWLSYKEFDPRQGTLPGVNQNASDEAPF